MPEAATQTAFAAPELVPQPDETARWKDVLGLPCTISVEIPIAGFTVSQLLNLEPQAVIGSTWFQRAPAGEWNSCGVVRI